MCSCGREQASRQDYLGMKQILNIFCPGQGIDLQHVPDFEDRVQAGYRGHAERRVRSAKGLQPEPWMHRQTPPVCSDCCLRCMLRNFVSKLLSVHKEDPAFSVPKLGKMRSLASSEVGIPQLLACLHFCERKESCNSASATTLARPTEVVW